MLNFLIILITFFYEKYFKKNICEAMKIYLFPHMGKYKSDLINVKHKGTILFSVS